MLIASVQCLKTDMLKITYPSEVQKLPNTELPENLQLIPRLTHLAKTSLLLAFEHFMPGFGVFFPLLYIFSVKRKKVLS